MKKIVIALLIIFSLLSSKIIYPQSLNIEWQKVFGGDGEDNLQSIKQTTDGGYILVVGHILEYLVIRLRTLSIHSILSSSQSFRCFISDE